jgi:hypothetical protein
LRAVATDPRHGTQHRENNHPADYLEHVHEPRLVRPSQLQSSAALDRDPRELGDRFFEYVFQVPANRIGSTEWSVPQLKVMQECITLLSLRSWHSRFFTRRLSGTSASLTPSSSAPFSSRLDSNRRD